ncbi:class I SAM-dependent methyltransferase [Nocardia callitridis]|uniref:Methyltransferase domain-containing protein n=1 Tax=Nocardia callitridis TaxID=648753 RepID=A0ABP9KKB7_9NOCA
MSNRRDARGDDPFGGRRPTSHERAAGRPWNASYADGPAPWDTGAPQPAVVRLVADGVFSGTVLDAGCGTGENALCVAALGIPVLGVDVAETALAMARAKSEQRALAAEFAWADALRLDRLDRTFDTVLDCGLFHTFDRTERAEYLTSLAAVSAARTMLYLLCLSDQGSATGPHPVAREELSAAFDLAEGWRVVGIEPDRIRTRFHDENGAPAWLATVERAT